MSLVVDTAAASLLVALGSAVVSIAIALLNRDLEHRLTSLEERSLSKDDLVKFNQMQTTLSNTVDTVAELCTDYKEMIRMIYQDLPVALKKTTTLVYDGWLDKLTTYVDSHGELKPDVDVVEARKIYSLIKADYTRALKKEDMGRQVMTRLILRRMERDFGFGKQEPKAVKRCTE